MPIRLNGSPVLHAASPMINMARAKFHKLMAAIRDKVVMEGRSPKQVLCQKCNAVDDGFCLKDEIWQEIRPEHQRHSLCLECVEIKLGRKLTLFDFQDHAINTPIFFGAAMVEDNILATYVPIHFETKDVVGAVREETRNSFTCDRCGYDHSRIAKEGGVVCICGTVYHNIDGKHYMFTYINPKSG